MTNDIQTSQDVDLSQIPESFENPGLAPHRPRMGDTDPVAAKRSERQVVVLFTLSILASIAGLVGFFVFPLDGQEVFNVRMSTMLLGIGLGGGTLGIGLAAVHWAKALMNDHEVIEERVPMESDAATKAEALENIEAGIADSNIARRPLIKAAMGTALALVPLTFLVPLIGNLGGDWDVEKFRRTAWRPVEGGDPENFYQGKYRYIAIDPPDRDGNMRRIKASDITQGTIVHVLPAGLGKIGDEHFMNEKAKAAVVLVRVKPELIKPLPGRENWSYDGILAYSKICTHVGCPVALYERTTHHLLCPCHQSTFDVTDHAKVVFGPAKRALPQLPIAVDDEGYLYAADDFDEPVGPSYWERER